MTKPRDEADEVRPDEDTRRCQSCRSWTGNKVQNGRMAAWLELAQNSLAGFLGLQDFSGKRLGVAFRVGVSVDLRF